MTDSQAPKRIHHATFYFPFGDLVIQSAPDADGVSTLFRVNKSLLAYNSPVFAGMFTLPGSGSVEAQDVYDGVPVVRLSDPSDELATLFSALHNPSSLSFPRYDPDIPILLTGVMRLATKYEFNNIRARVVEILHESWPQTLEQLLRFRSETRVIGQTHARAKDWLVDGKSFEERIPEPAAAIRFARDFNVPSILPLAYYTLAGISRDKDWDESREERNHQIRARFTHSRTRTARWRLLKAVDYDCVVKCRERFAHIVSALWSSFSDPKIAHDFGDTYIDFDSISGEDCVANLRRMKGILTYEEGGILGESSMANAISLPDPLGLVDCLDSAVTRSGVCVYCSNELFAMCRGFRKLTWERLSTIILV